MLNTYSIKTNQLLYKVIVMLEEQEEGVSFFWQSRLPTISSFYKAVALKIEDPLF